MLRVPILALLLAHAIPAAVVRLEVHDRSDVLAGKSFGDAGPYERASGRIHFAIDPAKAPNAVIADLDRAPRNAAGLVEFSADFYILKPRDPARGNGAVLLDVVNRGRKTMFPIFNRAAGSNDPQTAADFGDALLLEQGYTLAWIGWQHDTPREAGLMRAYLPRITGLTGMVRSQFILDEKEMTHSLADRTMQVIYPATNPATATLTVRDRVDAPATVIPRGKWSIVEGTHLSIPGGFAPGRIYELVYEAKDPYVSGLGPAAIRDFIAFLKYGHGAGLTFLSDHRRYIKRAYGFGVSQSGRFLRTFVHDGFNADEQGRKVFDGLMPHVAGAGRGSFNRRFAQPSRDGHPFLNAVYPTDIFPFADTGEPSLLTRAEAANVVPKIFFTNSSYEYWGRSASLIHTTPDASTDLPLASTSRAYLLAGGQHGPAAFPPVQSKLQQHLPNPNPYTYSLRALLAAMDKWVKDGVEPPPSQVPTLASKTLATPSTLAFPKISGVLVPQHIATAWRADYEREPVEPGKPYPALVPQTGADGNETSGIRMPGIAVPLATYAGWNLRAASIGAPDELYSMVGSYIPFPKTRAARAKAHDPRRSIEELYASKDDYLSKLTAAAKTLAASGYLLERDIPALVERGGAEWEFVHK